MVWDSHPLALAATPKQVYIDGIPQFDDPQVSPKADMFQVVPKTPNFDKEAKEAVQYDGLPPLAPRESGDAVFTNVRSVWSQDENGVAEIYNANDEGDERLASVFISQGRINCVAKQGVSVDCMPMGVSTGVEVIDLKGGMLSPGLTTFGSPIGTVEIRLESSTNDGTVFDPLRQTIPGVLGDDTVIRAIDGLQFEGRNTL